MRRIIETLVNNLSTNLYEPIIIDNTYVIDPNNMSEKVKVKFEKMENLVEKEDTIIDLGCNFGYYLMRFKKKFDNNIKYIGIDNDKYAITMSRLLMKYYKLRYIDFHVTSVEKFIVNKPKSNVTILMQLPYPFQFSEYLLNVVKILKSTSNKIILECGRSPKYRDEMISINCFERKLKDIMDCELINIVPDVDDEYLYMYSLNNKR